MTEIAFEEVAVYILIGSMKVNPARAVLFKLSAVHHIHLDTGNC